MARESECRVARELLELAALERRELEDEGRDGMTEWERERFDELEMKHGRLAERIERAERAFRAMGCSDSMASKFARDPETFLSALLDLGRAGL